MNPLLISILLGLALLATTHVEAAPKDHLVDGFPGFEGELQSKIYKGYIPLYEEQFFMHYIFVEAYNDPENAPIALWMEGGPGESGLVPFFSQHGPLSINQFSMHPDSDKITPLLNPFTWAQNVSMIFFESPVYVGYSYCVEECPKFNDTSSAEFNYEFIYNFFEFFPEYKKNDFYLTGESYGGIYVPMLAHQILNHDNEINLKGMLIANCCTGITSEGGCSNYDTQFMIDYLYNHGHISTSLYQEILASCDPGDFSPDICMDYIDKVMDAAGPFVSVNVYTECPAYEEAKVVPELKGNDTPCFQNVLIPKYLNTDEVKAFFGSTKFWIEKYDPPGLYTWSEPDTAKYYKEVIDLGLKVMIYFGDVDMNVPYNSGYYWIKKNFKEIGEWHPWTLPQDPHNPWEQVPNKIVAGYKQDFEGISFLTIRGAGHVDAKDKPLQTLVLFENFIFDIPFNKFEY